MKNIVLIGFMGTGKTSVGIALSKRLNRPVYDVDAAIEADEKNKISEIFKDRGEAYFRHLEKRKIEELARLQDVVLTTGGGAVTDPENIAHLKENGFVVCLTSTVETILKRVGRSKNRPLLAGGDPKKAVEDLLVQRKRLYEEAMDCAVPTDGKTPDEVARLIEGELGRMGLLGGKK